MRLTELEGHVLALIWLHGPVTRYRLHRLLQEAGLSGSKGAVYPIVERFFEAHIISGEFEGRRTLVTIRGAGKLYLDRWMFDWARKSPVDPIRTREEFLHALRWDERRSLVVEMIQTLRLESLVTNRRKQPWLDARVECVESLDSDPILGV